MSIGKRTLALYQRLDGASYAPLLVLIIAIQGTVLISQSLAALLLPPAAVGVIRTFESIFSVLVLIAGFGAPALALREMAARPAEAERARTLRDLAVLPLAGAIVVVVAAAIASALQVSFVRGVAHVLPLVLALLIAVNLTRLLAAVAQGLLIVGHVYRWTAAGAVLCIIIQTAFALRGTLDQWVLGRIVGEVVLLSAIAAASRSRVPYAAERAPWDGARFAVLVRSAMTLNGGLVIRMATDAAPIVLLSLAAARAMSDGLPAAQSLRNEVGYFGIASLGLTLATLPISVVSQQALPLLTQAFGRGDAVSEIRRFSQKMLGVSIVIASIVAGAALVIRAMPTTNLTGAMVALAMLMIAVPIKAIAIVGGSVLTARGRYFPPIVVNLVELFIVVVGFTSVARVHDAKGTVAIVIVASIASMIGLTIASKGSA